jgi:hypothetical protein
MSKQFFLTHLNKEVFMELPKGLHQDGGSLQVYRLLKANFYGLKQVGHMW